MDNDEKVEKTEEELIQDAIRMNGQLGVVTIVCQHCGNLVRTNYVPLKQFWRRQDELKNEKSGE